MKFAEPRRSPFWTGLKSEVDAYFATQSHGRLANRAFFFKATLIVATYVAAYLGILFWADSFWTALPLFVLMGISGVMVVFNIVHDASHQAVFKSKRANNRLRYLGDLVGINTYIWDIRHNVQHHSFTNVLGGDLIIDAAPLIRLSPAMPYRAIHRFQRFYAPLAYMLYAFYWILLIDFRLFRMKNICNLKNLRHPVREWAILIGSKVFYFAYNLLLPWLITDFSFGQIFLLFMAMQLVGGALLSGIAILGHFVETTSFPEPIGDEIANNWAEHELETTSDFSPGSRLAHWITGGLNTHVAHHLFPRVCHIHYLALTPIIEQYCRENGYPYDKETLGEALASHFEHLRRLGKPPQAPDRSPDQILPKAS